MKIGVKNPQNLREMILRKGFTQRGFGRETGVSGPYVAQILNGDRNPGPEIAKKFTDTLETEFDTIFFIQEGHKSDQSTA